MIADASPKGAFFDSTTVKMTTKSVKDGDESLKKTTVTASVSNGDGGAAGAEEKAFVLKASSMKRESDRVLEIDDDVALTFPQRVSCSRPVLPSMRCALCQQHEMQQHGHGGARCRTLSFSKTDDRRWGVEKSSCCLQ